MKQRHQSVRLADTGMRRNPSTQKTLDLMLSFRANGMFTCCAPAEEYRSDHASE